MHDARDHGGAAHDAEPEPGAPRGRLDLGVVPSEPQRPDGTSSTIGAAATSSWPSIVSLNRSCARLTPECRVDLGPLAVREVLPLGCAGRVQDDGAGGIDHDHAGDVRRRGLVDQRLEPDRIAEQGEVDIGGHRLRVLQGLRLQVGPARSASETAGMVSASTTASSR